MTFQQVSRQRTTVSVSGHTRLSAALYAQEHSTINLERVYDPSAHGSSPPSVHQAVTSLSNLVIPQQLCRLYQHHTSLQSTTLTTIPLSTLQAAVTRNVIDQRRSISTSHIPLTNLISTTNSVFYTSGPQTPGTSQRLSKHAVNFRR